MPKTTNLGLNLTTDNSTRFQDWRESIDGEGSGDSKSNMQIIDEFAGGIYGVSGSISIYTSNWADNSYSRSISGMGKNDAVFFSPSSAADKAALDEANCFVSASGNTVTFTVQNVPTVTVYLNYFIVRGKA